MIPAYLEFFGFGTATPEDLRARVRRCPTERRTPDPRDNDATDRYALFGQAS